MAKLTKRITVRVYHNGDIVVCHQWLDSNGWRNLMQSTVSRWDLVLYYIMQTDDPVHIRHQGAKVLSWSSR